MANTSKPRQAGQSRRFGITAEDNGRRSARAFDVASSATSKAFFGLGSANRESHFPSAPSASSDSSSCQINSIFILVVFADFRTPNGIQPVLYAQGGRAYWETEGNAN